VQNPTFPTAVTHHTCSPMKMEQTQCSETPENHPEKSIRQHYVYVKSACILMCVCACICESCAHACIHTFFRLYVFVSCLFQIIEKFFDTRAAAPPYKTNALSGFGRMLNVPCNVLKDFIQIMKLELVGECMEMCIYSVLSIYRPCNVRFSVFTVRHLSSRIKSQINNVIYFCVHRLPELPFFRIYRCK
jgi:hypothetical protein